MKDLLIHVPDDPEEAAAARAAIVADGRLTFGAIGLLLVILDHAPEWRVNFDALASWARDRRGELGEDEETVQQLLFELYMLGYVDWTPPPGDGSALTRKVGVFAVPRPTGARDTRQQVVYVIGHPGSPVVKIGTTSSLHARLRSLQTGSPIRLEVLWTCPGGRRLESWLHRTFSQLRLEGEWFDFRHWDPIVLVKRTVAQARTIGIE